jgi:hypothetical protein
MLQRFGVGQGIEQRQALSHLRNSRVFWSRSVIATEIHEIEEKTKPFVLADPIVDRILAIAVNDYITPPEVEAIFLSTGCRSRQSHDIILSRNIFISSDSFQCFQETNPEILLERSCDTFRESFELTNE